MPFNIIELIYPASTRCHHDLNHQWAIYKEILCRLAKTPQGFYAGLDQFLGYRQTSNIRCILVGNELVDHSDVVGAAPVGTAPSTSSFST